MKISVIIPAAGTSSRFQTNKGTFFSKLFEELDGKPLILHSILTLGSISDVSEIVIPTHPKLKKELGVLIRKFKVGCRIKIVNGGKTRAESVWFALKQISSGSSHVMIHDGARPLVRSEWIKQLTKNLNGNDGVVLGRMAVPTIKRLSENSTEINETLNRRELFEAETPQLFKKEILLSAYRQIGERAFQATDDSSLVELIGGSVKAVLHEGSNLKITTKEDLVLARNMKESVSDIRFGLGFDRHRLVSKRPFYLGGIKIPSLVGPLGHSDGDPLLHAVIDGMLGALGLGDIGDFFPDTSKRFKNIPSTLLLREAQKLILKKGFKVSQIDATVFLERPKLGPHKKKIQKHLSKLFDLDISKVGIKAKTAEGLGAEGAGEAVSAEALVVLKGKGF